MFKVIITGASGFLGSAIHEAFKSCKRDGGIAIRAFSHSRSGPDLVPLDLLNNAEMKNAFQAFQPDWVIHCAAQRKPDLAEKYPDETRKLNEDVPRSLAILAKELKFTLVYISTDFVFDGTSPPYTVSAKTNPLQFYGQTKRDGELAVLGVEGAKVIVLRVPILYGPCPVNSDSAVNLLLDVVQDQSGKQYKMDHYGTRYPTNTVDTASFLVRLSAFKKPIPPILHYSAEEPFTKYEMCLIFSRMLGLPHTHIIPDAEPPKDGGATRPRDCHLYTGETEQLGIEGGLGLSLFEEWWTEYLK